jgi:hypothetical protein
MRIHFMRTRPFALAAIVLVGSAVAQQPEGQFERTLNVSGPVELDATTDSGGISVKPGPAGSVQIRATLKGQRGGNWNMDDVARRIRELEANPPVEQTGNRIRVGHVREPDILRGVSMRLEILTPPQTTLHATADSGGIRVEGISGPVDCETDSGGIHATGINGDVKASVDSGGVHVANVRGSVWARADSGGIEASDVSGAVDAETDSGGIRISQSTPAPIRAHADSGGATVKLAPSGGYDVVLASGSGRVVAPEMTVRGTFSRQRVEGKVRGGGPLVDVKVDSGNVDVQ